MPKAQLHKQLETELGKDWRSNFQEFDDVPIAAASIGQVHRATLLNGDRVAIKIQYPGVAESISSDLLNLKRLVTYTNILPRGLYIDEIIRVGKEELTAECDYIQEADNQELFTQLIEQSGMANAYVVPRVYRELSTSRILTTQLISGVAVDKAVNLSQDVRNGIARRILQLTIRELFDWRFMQTDPNWSNFMYNASTDTIGLVDFGAAREYPKEFVDDYFNVVWAAANSDEKTLMDASLKLHFLTGDESPAMMRAHMAAGMVVGEPFRSNEPFDFYASKLTTRLGKHTEVFMHGRLTPPPQEVYSLHRKLAGAFLICIKLRAVVPCRDVLEEVQRTYYATKDVPTPVQAESDRVAAPAPAPPIDRYAKFRKMLKVGAPRARLEADMRRRGLDPAGLDGSVSEESSATPPPKTPTPSQTATLSSIVRRRLHFNQVAEVDRTPAHPAGSIWTRWSRKAAYQRMRVSEMAQREMTKLFVKVMNPSRSKSGQASRTLKATASADSSMSQTPSRRKLRGSVMLLQKEKAQNIAITLSRVKTPFSKIAQEVELLSGSSLSDTAIKSLLAMWPSSAEQRALDQYAGSFASLGTVSWRLAPCSGPIQKIPRVKQKLQCLLLKVEFPSRIHELRERFAEVLVYILDLGNWLNKGDTATSNDAMLSFSLESLAKLTFTKAFDGTNTFLDSVVANLRVVSAASTGFVWIWDLTLPMDASCCLLQREYPDLLTFFTDLDLVAKCNRVCVDALAVEIQSLNEGFQMLKAESDVTVDSNQGSDACDVSRSAIRQFAMEVEQELRGVQLLHEQLENNKLLFLRMFEENKNASLDSHLEVITQFVAEFQACAAKKTSG
ncbi:hypothetical protein BBJ28_00005941 [Nothophytophthora sp. Chile5]|nr:hypothetical protein BBJ28_00005941 [Nothophytophthora sp. Chile5]